MPLFLTIWLILSVLSVIALSVLRPDRNIRWLVLISLLTAFSLWVSLPNNPGIHVDTNGDGEFNIDKNIDVRQGLDLAGGLKVLLEADLPEGQSPNDGSMEEARRIIESRIDSLGALEPVIQKQGDRRLIIELPGYDDPESAISLIRETALLEFVALPSSFEAGTLIRTSLSEENYVPVEGEEPLTGPIYETVMTGDILQSADVGFDQTSNTVLVTFSLTRDGASIFGVYTQNNIGSILGIVLDGVVISAPRIQSAIVGGQGTITGDFTVEEATDLATKLRYGALPVPFRVESTSTIGPTLGALSVEKSIQAGIIGIIVVLTFMLIYYRVPGIAAALALIIFALLNFALYKLIPVTLTLPAITGFLISVGTAVDGNILIFERMKEELRKGSRVHTARKAGFDRAWTSIRDSNLSTLIICAVLYLFGTSFGAGAIRGFAVTLALGLVINLFTAVTVTRTFLHFLMMPIDQEMLEKRPWLLGL